MNFIYEEKDGFELNFTLNSHENSATINVNWLLAIIYDLYEVCRWFRTSVTNYSTQHQKRRLQTNVECVGKNEILTLNKKSAQNFASIDLYWDRTVSRHLSLPTRYSFKIRAWASFMMLDTRTKQFFRISEISELTPRSTNIIRKWVLNLFYLQQIEVWLLVVFTHHDLFVMSHLTIIWIHKNSQKITKFYKISQI